MQVGQQVILPMRAATVGLSGGQLATVVGIRKSSLGMADVVTVKTTDGLPYFDRDYEFQPA